jgi:cytochrome c biogenesis protein
VAASLGDASWRTLTNVRFAITQITALVLAGLVGSLVRQVPSSTLRNPVAYAAEIADMHVRWDGIAPFGWHIGPGMVDLFDRLGFFRIFSAPWFVFLLILLTISIVCCTLNRLPRIWRDVRRIAVVQPIVFFDRGLPNRVALSRMGLAPEDLVRLLRSRHYRVRRVDADASGPGTVYLNGDRNQYMKLATLLTHLGLILFLIGGAVTVSFGYETVLFVANGQTAPVQAVGTPHNLLVKNISFQAPQRPNGSFEDFSTDLAVYQDGQQIARKTIRVNDPLEVAGFVFHQNTFGPSIDMRILSSAGQLVWSGPVLLTGALLSRPQGFLVVPGSDLGLLIVLDKRADGISELALEGLGPPAADGSAAVRFAVPLTLGEATNMRETWGYTVVWDRADAWTGMVVKRDPGQGFIWVAFIALISGLILTFYFPRRRVWIRLTDNQLNVAMMADRYVDTGREFKALLEQIASLEHGSQTRSETLHA